MEVFICKGGSTLLDQFVEHVHFFHQKTFSWIRFSKIVSNSSLKNCVTFESQKLSQIQSQKIVSHSNLKFLSNSISRIRVKISWSKLGASTKFHEIANFGKSKNGTSKRKFPSKVLTQVRKESKNMLLPDTVYGLKAPQVLRKYVQNIHLWVRQAFLRNA